MIGFLTFVSVMSFTPGPNTIMAMSEGQEKGFRGGLIFNSGIFAGFIILGGIISLFASFFQQYDIVITIIKVIGTIYLLYLSYHVFISLPGESSAAGKHPFVTGLLLQSTNVKVYLYFITGLSTFAMSGLWGSLPGKLGLMVIIGVLGTLLWTLAGQLIQTFYKQHYRILNALIALLLLYSAYDLW